MRIASLTFSIAASILLLGVAGQASAVPSCADLHLPYFAKDLNKNAAWNSYVSSTLAGANQWPGWSQMKGQFETQQCAAAWGNGHVYIGVKNRSCTFTAPVPTVNGTTIDYGAASSPPSKNAILKLRGCGGLVAQPQVPKF